MNALRTLFLLMFLPGLVMTQPSELAVQQEMLARDCKNVRGHAGRVVEETSQSDFNTDLARAHAGEVVKNLKAMEQRLQSIRTLCTKEQLGRIASEQASLEKTCVLLQDLAGRLEKELGKEAPDRLAARKMSIEVRNEMTKGNEVHLQMKKKLGLK